MMRGPIFAIGFGVAALRAGALLSEDVVRLPDVDTLMAGAEDSVKEFARQDEVMRQEVQSRQRESQNLLALRRKAMEQNLTLLDARVLDAQQRNLKVQARIQELTNSTEEQKAVVKNWKTSNEFLREALFALQQKVQVVQDFLIESVNTTDSVGVQELAVLRETTPRPTVETFLRDVQGQGDDSADAEVSLLATDNAISARAPRAQQQQGLQPRQSPSEVGIPDLSKHLQALADAEEEGEAKITGRYIVLREVAEERLRVAQADGRDLLKKEEELVALSQDLKLAAGHLKDAHTDLLARINGMRRFADQSLNHGERASKASSRALQDARSRAAAVRSASNVTTTANASTAGSATAAANSATAASEAGEPRRVWNARGQERRHKRWAKAHQAISMAQSA